MISKSNELEVDISKTTSLQDVREGLRADLLSIKLVESLEKQLSKYGEFQHIGGTVNANETNDLYEIKDIVKTVITASRYSIILKYEWKVEPKTDLESLFNEIMK